MQHRYLTVSCMSCAVVQPQTPMSDHVVVHACCGIGGFPLGKSLRYRLKLKAT